MLKKREIIPRAADWGYGMSVGIGVICSKDATVVMCSDSRVDFGGYSAEVAQKNTPFGRHCAVLTAGDDVEYASPILDRAFELVVKEETNEKVPPAVVAAAIDQAYAEQVSKIIENRILRKHGFDAETFRLRGRQQCTGSQYLSLCNKIEQLKVKLQFLVCGLDSSDGAKLIVVDGSDAPEDYSSIGMWAIGSGAYAAMSWLAFHADRGHFNRYGSVKTKRSISLPLQNLWRKWTETLRRERHSRSR